MSLEAWGDEGDALPEGCVSQEAYDECQNDRLYFLKLLMMVPNALGMLAATLQWDPTQRSAVNVLEAAIERAIEHRSTAEDRAAAKAMPEDKRQ